MEQKNGRHTKDHFKGPFDVISKEDRERVAKMKKRQCMKRFVGVYNRLKDHPLIRWKESMKEALGLEIPDEIGLDI